MLVHVESLNAAFERKRKMSRSSESSSSLPGPPSTKLAPSSPPDSATWWENTVSADDLAEMILQQQTVDQILLVDVRSFIEFNQSYIVNSINICCNKMIKRRLQQNKLKIEEFLTTNCQLEITPNSTVVVYDGDTKSGETMPDDSMINILGSKCQKTFSQVYLLQGGFLEFSSRHPSLLESKSATPLQNAGCLSQPCMPVSNVGPTKILPYLYLGSMKDALNGELAQANGITCVLNVSMTCPQPTHIQDSHFLRIPVNDNYSEKLLPYFYEAFQFIDKVREANGRVLVHCLAGVSRSPTLAIAYIMRNYQMASEDAYRYVKEKRVSISPNFNFLGQLLEYEQQINGESNNPGLKRRCLEDIRADLLAPSSFTAAMNPKHARQTGSQTAHVHSPTSAMAKLKFDSHASLTAPVRTTNSPTVALARLKFSTITELSAPSDQPEFMQCFPSLPTIHNTNSNNNQETADHTRRPLSLGVSTSSPQIKLFTHSEESSKTDQTFKQPASPATEFKLTQRSRTTRPRSVVMDTERQQTTTLSTPTTPTTNPQSCDLQANLSLLLASGVDANRLSRSLEDVITPTSPKTGDSFCKKCKSYGACSCKAGELVVAASSGSISSNGSHNSLHGSMEIIVS